MLEMVMHSAKLFFAGKLFQDPGKAMRQFAIGVGAGVAAVLIVGQFAPLWAATAAGGALTGLLQPYLFKDLKYA
ncbi:MAG: hypothetical protein HC869_00345 [Rhodospirillales bacterium]|nr:hypothetical protein [Rhodospirillales bacterium]